MHHVRASHIRDSGDSRQEFKILSLETRTLFHVIYLNFPPPILHILFPGKDIAICPPKENCSVVSRYLLDCILVHVLEDR